jgi:mutator protein MutT
MGKEPEFGPARMRGNEPEKSVDVSGCLEAAGASAGRGINLSKEGGFGFCQCMDWTQWVPQEKANLCFIVKAGRVLLIRKKRGLGAGKINAPGGKLELGETPEEAAIRETREEVGVTPLGLEERGLLRFQFTDGYSLLCWVFVARDLEGEPVSTDEADPIWVPLEAVPYEEMWADDSQWLPLVLAGGKFTGSFVFDQETMLEGEVSSHGEFQRVSKPRVVVAGCGFVGLATARRFHARGWEVTGVTHSAESAAALAGEGFSVVTCDITKPREVARVLGSQVGLDAVVHCASSGRGGEEAYRQVYLRGAQVLIGTLAPRNALFTSSTSVYAQTDGEWVSEASEAEPTRETGRILRETEQWVIEHGGAVCRLSGIYGPGRSVLLRKYFAGEAVLEGDGTRWINQIHRDDAAEGIWAVVSQRRPGIFNVGDDRPLAQEELYRELRIRFGGADLPRVPEDRNRKRGWTHKRVSNAKLRSLGWSPRFSSFFEALQHDPDLVAQAQRVDLPQSSAE